ncbi:hypothetical protein OAM67_01570 [bacterium]|nr:hypothetical protein [bacterium]
MTDNIQRVRIRAGDGSPRIAFHIPDYQFFVTQADLAKPRQLEGSTSFTYPVGGTWICTQNNEYRVYNADDVAHVELAPSEDWQLTKEQLRELCELAA